MSSPKRSWMRDAPPPAKRRMSISDALIQHAAQKPSAPKPVFTLPAHPPSVERGAKAKSLAMDEAIGETSAWAGSFALQGFATEGLAFLGYPFLSELAQRPEYRVIAETIATEMTRKWIRFTSKDADDDSKDDRIAELEAEFERLNVRDLFCRATEQDGFFGRGHIYIDTGDSDDPAELAKTIGDGWDKASLAKLKKQPITALRTVEAVWCYPTSYNSNDPLKDDWYRPNSWFVQAKTVHSSRLLTFIGREVPDLLKPTYSFGGLSLSQMSKPYVDNFLRNRQSASDILNAFSVFVLMTNLSESLMADGDQLFKRADLFNMLRDNRGLMMLDKDTEDFKNVSASLAGITDILNKSIEMISLPAHAPLVKLWGIQPAGLNADSEGIMRSFYDYIHSFQEHLYRDKIRRLMGLIMISIWGETDDSIGFEFEPLWTLDEKGMAEVEKLKAETDQIHIDSGVLSPEEVRQRVASDAGSDYASIDVSDVPDLLEEESEGLQPKGGGSSEGGAMDHLFNDKAA